MNKRHSGMGSVGKIIHFFKLLLLTMVVFFYTNYFLVQPSLAKQTITVSVTQVINFGAFCLTGDKGGDIILGYDGRRTSTGNLLLFAMPPFAQPAIFEIDYKKNRDVNITFNATSILTCSDGGTLTFDLGPTDRGINGSSFTMNGDVISLYLGGTLHIPGKSPPGIYSGSYEITFNTE